MTAKQENKLSMFLAVKAVCDRNPATIATLPAFADGYTEFTTHVANIQTLAQNQSVDATGLAADKQQLRKDMATAAAIIGVNPNAVIPAPMANTPRPCPLVHVIPNSARPTPRDCGAASVPRNCRMLCIM